MSVWEKKAVIPIGATNNARVPLGLFTEDSSKASSNRGPGKVRLVDSSAAGGKIEVESGIGKNAYKSVIQLIRLVRRDKDDTGIGDGWSGFRSRKRNDG